MRTCLFTINVKQKRAFYLSVIRSLFEHFSFIWRPLSPNQISKFDVIQKRAVKWINGRIFDHYSDEEFYEKQKELNILPIKFKFIFNDVVLFFKIVNSLVPIKLPREFVLIKASEVRFTRSTENIIN